MAIELSKGPVVSALQKYDFIDIFPINPSTLAKYSEAFQQSKSKDDTTDAEMAVDLLLRHPEHFKVLKPLSTEMRALTTMVEQRIVGMLRSQLRDFIIELIDGLEH